MNFQQKLIRLMQERRYEVADVAKAIGRTPTIVYRWVSGRKDDENRRPTNEQLMEIARLFGVTMESLTDPGMEIRPSSLPPDEEQVLAAYRLLRDENGLTAAVATVRLTQEAFRFAERAVHPEDVPPGGGA